LFNFRPFIQSIFTKNSSREIKDFVVCRIIDNSFDGYYGLGS